MIGKLAKRKIVSCAKESKWMMKGPGLLTSRLNKRLRWPRMPGSRKSGSYRRRARLKSDLSESASNAKLSNRRKSRLPASRGRLKRGSWLRRTSSRELNF